MSGFEIAGLAVSTPAVVELLIKAAVKGYNTFQSAQSAGPDFQRYQYELRVMCTELQGWESKLKQSGGDLAAILGATSLRYKVTLDTLAMIAGVFVEVDQLNEKNGITCDSPNTSRISSIQSPPETSQNRSRDSWMRKIGFGSKDSTNKKPARALVASTIRTLSSPGSSTRSSLQLDLSNDNISSNLVLGKNKIKTPQNLSEQIDLDVQVTGLDDHIRDLETKAHEYHKTLTALQRYKWAIYNSEKLEELVRDLKLYMGYLDRLTKDYFKAQVDPSYSLSSPPLTPFSEFNVPFVPSHPLVLRFCGRAEELMKIEDYLQPTKSFANNRHPRLILNLSGMGGIGKSQIARYFVDVNKENYSAILWVHAADTGTIDASAKRILKELIAHYATKYIAGKESGLPNGPHRIESNPETQFQSIATDLHIPGQIDSSGELKGAVAEEPWNCIRNWLARENNSRWCIVFDSVDTEPDIEGLNNLIPPCGHGHVIITSRLRVAWAEIVTVAGLDPEASIMLLLGGKKDDPAVAGKVADVLGHLPVALSQAAAYVVKKDLGFSQYLKRLAANTTGLLGTAHLKYTEGVFSCWKLSVETLMKSNPFAVYLLRLCSFLSPDGVSEELLHFGVGALYGESAVSMTDESLDDLVTYSLMTRKPKTVSTRSQWVWIHPLVQLWARDSYSEEGSVVLEQNRERLAKLHTEGVLEAIILVGFGLNHQVGSLDSWIYERENAANINLCIHQCLVNLKLPARSTKDQELGLGIAILYLGVFKNRWQHLKIAAKLFETSYRLVTNIHPKDVQDKRALALVRVLVFLACLSNEVEGVNVSESLSDPQDLSLQIDEISQSAQQFDDNRSIFLGAQKMKAAHQSRLGDISGSLKTYQQCIDKLENDQNMQETEVWIYNLKVNCAFVHIKLGQNDKAEELLHQCLNWHRRSNQTHSPIFMDILFGLSKLGHMKGDYATECDYLSEFVERTESQIGLAHKETLSLLEKLRAAYTASGQLENAEHVSKKITAATAALRSQDNKTELGKEAGLLNVYSILK
ncbi:hypothetical protein TWF718_009287 [Orbilia javanica]|uniref:NB-ARC domain-containing protein n=1 Tax=Orbilia javanica TaxID=47235 RepID=A0AAN8MP82_9PEZI